jgi:peroxiredoxin
MSDASPPDPVASPAPEPAEGQAASVSGAVSGAPLESRKPRKIFLLIGVVLAVALGIGLFTSLGTSQSSTTAPYQGGPVPSFEAANVGDSGPATVSVPADGGSGGTPAVLLFFGAWCSACQAELPPLAEAVRLQDEAHGRLSKVHVIGVDSLDAKGSAESFIRREGVTFPVAYDPSADITSGTFYFDGDPYAVFVKGDGTIAKIVRGAVLNQSSFTADERALIPSGT